MNGQRPLTRVRGRALRKNLPPSKPAPPPPPPPQSSPHLPPHASPPAELETNSPARESPTPWSNRPPPDVLEHLREVGLAYRYLRPPPTLDSPPPQKRVRKQIPEKPWELRKPRTAAIIERKIQTNPVLYKKGEPRLEQPLLLYRSAREAAKFAELMAEKSCNGESMSVALGDDVNVHALEFMSERERNMYHTWRSGVRLPDENWDSLKVGLEESDDIGTWERRAKYLNVIYDVSVVDAAKAKGWWNSCTGWRPLLLAVEKAYSVQYVCETAALTDLANNCEKHALWTRGCLSALSDNFDNAINVLDRRFADLRTKLQKIMTPPISPERPDRDTINEPEIVESEILLHPDPQMERYPSLPSPRKKG